MKKLFFTLLLFCCFTSLTNLKGQTCTPYEGLKVVVLQYGINSFGQQATQAPTLSSEGSIYLTNHLITWNETTGQLQSTCSSGFGPAGSTLGSEHYGAYCACIVPGPVFRSVNYACQDDINTCGTTNNPLPVTDGNTNSTNWSSGTTWINNTYADLPTAPAIFITKPINLDVDISVSANRWIVVSNSGAATINAGTTFTNNSVIQVRANGFFQNNGTIKGAGQVQGAFTNNNILAPGNSPGTFSITGNYTATGNAIHQIEIASLSSYDQIKIGGDWTTVGGNAVLNGALNVTLLNGYIPSPGDSYKIFTFTSSSGSFASTGLPFLPNGLVWSIHYNATDISLEVVMGTPLPLNFTNTKAYNKNNGVQVDWLSENQNNVRIFEVEKSADGIHFNKYDIINAKSGSSNSYGWFDATPANGNNYYRIKAIDFDGKFIYSAMQMIKFNKDKFLVYPNPIKKGESLQINFPKEKINKIEILNASGQIVYRVEINTLSVLTIPVPALWAAGQYIIKLTSESGVEIQKILIQ